MKNDSAVSYSGSAASESEAEQTRPTVVSEKKLIEGLVGGLNEPIDVNFDQLEDDEPAVEKIESEKPYVGGYSADHNDRKNGKTLAVIALMTMFMFLLAGLSIKFSSNSGTNSLTALFDSNKPVSPDPNTSVAVADDAFGSLSDILSTRISLISSKNPKFIVTADGKKIVPSDIIDGSLTVVDILADHIVVTSKGAKLKIAY